MIDLTTIYGSALVLLACWATYTTSRVFTSRGGWRGHRTLVVVGVIFVASCLLPGIALLAVRFEPWMLIPLGVSYLALLPLPCYWYWANHGWLHVGRTVAFLLVGTAFVAAGLGLIPLSWFGLSST
jgi:hypothetical protein